MKRLHLVELEDLPWFPAVLRDGGTAYLSFVTQRSGHARMLAPVLARAVEATGATRVIDLCSGAGGPVGEVTDALAEAGRPLEVLLTDRYPNAGAFEAATRGHGGRVRARLEPVDATAVPAELRGLRTIFNAFHHFRPEAARAILADAAAARQPIAVFEVVSREPLMLLAMLLTPITVTLTLPLWRPFNWKWIPLTWILPLMQLFVLWDGLVSWLRIYSVPELRELVADLQVPGWQWEVGTLKLGDAPAHATWLVGRPTAVP